MFKSRKRWDVVHDLVAKNKKKINKRFAVVDRELLIFDGIVTCRRSLSLSLNIRYWTQSLRLFHFFFLECLRTKRKTSSTDFRSFFPQGLMFDVASNLNNFISFKTPFKELFFIAEHLLRFYINFLFNSTRFQRSCKNIRQFFLPSQENQAETILLWH